MDFKKETISSFFGSQKIQYSIPAYQRAYSWDQLQTKTFLEDLIEHKNSGKMNPYCYGNILLETISANRKYEIIDGQQRITTVSLFIRSLLNIISERAQQGIEFKNSEGDPIIVDEEEEIYFRSHGTIKLRPTEYDKACFDTIVIDNKNTYNCQTPSQKRMLDAKKFFSVELKKLSDQDLIAIFETIQNALVNHIELSGKKESALMFELQNNRGKPLTNLEKLKSFLMYQLYVYSLPEETEGNIEYVSSQFNPIYNIINQISLQLGTEDEDMTSGINEDNILIYHSYAYSKKNFGYRNLMDIIEEFKLVTSDKKVEWIRNYAYTLYTSFACIQEVLTIKDDNLDKLKKMKMPFFVYPFIIKGFKNKQSLPKLFKLLEILSFRYKLINSRADIRGRLSDLIKMFDGDVEWLTQNVQIKMEASYWGEKRFIDILNGNMFLNNMCRYFLWEYEQSLQRKGYIIQPNAKIEQESIEHISPQTEPQEKVSSGYEITESGLYSDDFRENYVHKLGNLLLISQSHNSSIGNKPFKEKLYSYSHNPLLRQQVQIKSFIEDEKNPVWDSKAIDKRHKEMLDFAKQRWSYCI